MIDLEGIFNAGPDPQLTTIQAAVRKLRRSIMQGDLRPGQKLVEANLCSELEISRASLREALRALAAERLINLVPNRGPSVAKLTDQDVEEIHEVWALLTGEAVHRFAEVAGRDDVRALAKAFEQVKQAGEARTPFELLVATNVFFMNILSHCGNNLLLDVVISLVSRINFLRAQALTNSGWRALYVREIEEILRAIQGSNPGVARLAVKRHVASCCAAAKHIMAAETQEKSRPRRRANKKAA